MGQCWCASVSSTCQNGDKNSADCLVCDAVMSTKSMARKLSRLYIPMTSPLCGGMLPTPLPIVCASVGLPDTVSLSPLRLAPGVGGLRHYREILRHASPSH